jgi:hypothetical protein
MLNARGTGQLLIYPYYTVNHQQTLVSVINTTGHGKALKVRFREGHDGRDVASFNIYLGPFDSWVGAVFDTSSDATGAAAIATNDNSCTVPAFPLAPVPGTLHALTFSNANYSQGDYGTPSGTDHGPKDVARTREGFFEIIEMGEVVDQASGSPKTLEAITPVVGKPPGCAQVQNAWAGGGYWTSNANTDLLPPAGGVYGAAGIVDVAQGTLYAFEATTIDGFSDAIQHTSPGDSKPNLGTAVTDSAHGVATAYVPIGNAMIKADYPATTRGVDAVSAVLMADSLYNDFDIEPALGAATDWLVTFPTKHFYADPAIVGAQSSAIPPFEFVFESMDSKPAGACVLVEALFTDRSGYIDQSDTVCGLPPPGGLEGNFVCYEEAVIPIGSATAPSRALGSGHTEGLYVLDACMFGHPVSFDSGRVQIGTGPRGGPIDHLLRPSNEGHQFVGLPVVGFAATNYINANVTPGVLSNYSAAYPHRSSASCINSTNPQGNCQ